MNAKEFANRLDRLDPEYFGTSDIWSVFSEGEKRNILLKATNADKNLENFFSAISSPCCRRYYLSHVSPTLLSITLVGPEDGMEIDFRVPLTPYHRVPKETRQKIHAALVDHPRGMAERYRVYNSVAILFEIV